MVEQLFRVCDVDSGNWIHETVCKSCADEINVESKTTKAELDTYASRCYEADEEICPICDMTIDRSDSDI